MNRFLRPGLARLRQAGCVSGRPKARRARLPAPRVVRVRDLP